MELYAISVFDRISGLYDGVRLFVNQATAERWFATMLAKSDIADDLDLYHVGKFDTATGVFTSVTPEFIKRGVQQ